MKREGVGTLSRVGWIAANTVGAALRQGFLWGVAGAAVAVAAGTHGLAALNFGSGETRFIVDFGFGAMSLLGSLLAIVATSHLVFAEIEGRTALLLFTRSVGPGEFAIGKGLGVLLLIAVFSTVLTFTVMGLLLAAGYPIEAWWAIVMVGALQGLKFAVMAAFTLLVTSYARSVLFAMGYALLLLTAFQLRHVAAESYARHGSGWVGEVWKAMQWLLPDFNLFDRYDPLMGSAGEGSGYFWWAAAYAGGYLLVAGALASFGFRRREF